jgi:hypothetical protein
MNYNRISADCHLDLIWLPPDLFVSEAPAALKDRMPYVAEGPEGPRWVANNGATFGLAGGVGASGTKHVPGKQLRVDVMAATGLYEDGKKGIRRPGDPHLRVKEMDRDGVDAEVIYGILAAAAKLKDIEASTEMLRIYNTWMADFCRHYPDRHIGLANLPYGDIDAAVAEVHRVAKLGFKGIELSCSWDRRCSRRSRAARIWRSRSRRSWSRRSSSPCVDASSPLSIVGSIARASIRSGPPRPSPDVSATRSTSTPWSLTSMARSAGRFGRAWSVCGCVGTDAINVTNVSDTRVS